MACTENAGCYKSRQQAETEITELEGRLLEAARERIDISRSPSESMPIWTRAEVPESTLKPQERKRGPKADTENHEKVARIIKPYGEAWTSDDNLLEICDELDKQQVPVPKTWASRKDGVARTWSRGLHHYQHLVIKAIKDRLKAAGQA